MSRSISTGLVMVFVCLVALSSVGRPQPPPKSARGIDVEPVLNTAAQFRALLVGVNDYERLNDLRYCEQDVIGLRDRLVAMGFEANAIKCLTTGAPDPANRPSVRNVRERLEAVFRGLRDDAVLIIAFSGHGGSFEFGEESGQRRTESFFCAQDARLDDPLGTMISVRDVYDQLEECPARFKLLLVDACRDRHFAPPQARSAVNEAKSMSGFAKSLADRKLPEGTLALVSCSSGEQSYEDPKLSHGIFMHYVLDALGGAADTAYRGDGNRVVSYREFKDYVYRKTSDHAWAVYEAPQTPSFYTNWELPNFDLVEVAGPVVYTVWPFDADEAKRRQQETAKALGLPVENTNSIGMKLVLIPAGEFMMGSPESDESASDDEHPQHKVRISRPFYLGATEVTQGQWELVMETRPWEDEIYVKAGKDYAATYVSWEDAVEFCKRLSKQEGTVYRLPSEAEWEYACRAGTTTVYPFGDDASRLGEYAWFDENAYDVDEKYAHEVGQKKGNALGLFDMHGNVWEWVVDWYGEDAYKAFVDKTAVDPTGPPSGEYRVSRGGSWLLRRVLPACIPL